MNVLLSIRPEYVEEIASGAKRYEFRKAIFRNEDVEKVFVYSTAPVKKIVGAFSIGDIAEGAPSILWRRFGNESGLARNEFFEYFSGRNHGYAIEIERFQQFDRPIDPWTIINNFYPPQSFSYFDDRLIGGKIVNEIVYETENETVNERGNKRTYLLHNHMLSNSSLIKKKDSSGKDVQNDSS